MNPTNPVQSELIAKTHALFDSRYARECEQFGRFLVFLMVVQWFAGLAMALAVSPLTWIGARYEIHIHVLATAIIGGALSGISILHLQRRPAAASTRHVVAVCQLLWTCLLIHLTGGRIETHFHAFASLAILSLYRDWRILITATSVVAVDHLVRGIWYPQSVFGVALASPYRWLEHAAWVLFEVAFLIPGCIRLRKEVWELCRLQVETDAARSDVEHQVGERTQQLAATVQELDATLSKIEENKQFMETVIESVSGLFYVIDTHGRYVMWNEPMQTLLGLTSERMQEIHALEYIHPDDQANVAAKMEEVFVAGQAEAEARLVTPSGIRYVVLNGRRVVIGDRTLLVGSGQDISQRRAAELELMEFRETLNKTHDCVFIFNSAGLRFTYVNEGAIRQVGYTRDELLLMTPLDICPHYHDESFRQTLQILIEGQAENHIFESVHRTQSGGEVPVEVTLQFVKTEGEAGKFIAVVRDITRRRLEEASRLAFERERDALHRQLVESSRKAGMAEVASGVLHNVGNVLNSINVSTSLVKKNVENSAIERLEKLVELVQSHEDHFAQFLSEDPRGQQIPRYLQKVTLVLKDEKQQLHDECNDILQNVQHVKQVIQLQQSMAKCKSVIIETSVEELLHQAHIAVKDSLTKHRVQWRVETPPSPTVFYTDKQRVLQILINLITNAKDALIEAPCEQPTIDVNVTADDERIRFAVTDNGVGIATEDLEKIFRFGYTSKINGHGFGLHYCANCAAELGGQLTVTSAGPGRGATFELTIPRSHSTNAEVPTVNHQESAVGTG